MKKKFLIILSLLLVALLAVLLVACNDYEWGPIAGGNANGTVLSNGGFAVKQGDYLYLINGYNSTVGENTFGAQVKNSIIRVKQNADGTITDTPVIVVPKQVYWTEETSGFAIYGNWIYYATPNVDKNREGVASTTNLDFMRTSLDGTVTQLIFTASTRSIRYWFMPTRIVAYSGTTLTAIDFTALDEGKEISKVSKKVTTKQIATEIQSIMFMQDSSYAKGQGTEISDYVFFTKAAAESESYKNYNELFAMKYDGSGLKKLATLSTYDTAYKLTLVDMTVDSANQVSLFYTKQQVASQDTKNVGLYVNKIDKSLTFSSANEKCLTTIIASATPTVEGVSYDAGALVVDSSNNTYLLNGSVVGESVYSDDNKVIGAESMTVRNISKGLDGNYYVYYTASSSPSSLYRINLIKDMGTSPNAEVVLNAKFDVNWIDFDFITDGTKTYMYFFDSDDYSYVHYYELTSYAGKTVEETTFIGIMNDTDKTAKAEGKEE